MSNYPIYLRRRCKWLRAPGRQRDGDALTRQRIVHSVSLHAVLGDVESEPQELWACAFSHPLDFDSWYLKVPEKALREVWQLDEGFDAFGNVQLPPWACNASLLAAEQHNFDAGPVRTRLCASIKARYACSRGGAPNDDDHHNAVVIIITTTTTTTTMTIVVITVLTA
ncbi:hypothetical protein F4810DRAFT_712283 [Camillea tinctor]|nr:hypothetical protein F4810DRAFT_712283 [Camillea tinctor]